MDMETEPRNSPLEFCRVISGRGEPGQPSLAGSDMEDGARDRLL